MLSICILSRNWRLKWTMLSQLIFDLDFFEFLTQNEDEDNFVRIISRILLHLNGSITKFVLNTDYLILDDEDINHWILFLSRKGIKDLNLDNRDRTQLKMPTHLFSCLELKHLKLNNCCLHPPPGFHGFPYLSSLELCRVQFETNDFGDFFNQCHLLESLNLRDHIYSTGEVKLVETKKLENLKILSSDLVSTMITTSRSISELLSSLPKLQELDLEFFGCEFSEDGAKKLCSRTFPDLKALKLSRIDLDNFTKLSCAYELITSFPNLQALEITTDKNWDDDPKPAICSSEVDCDTMRLLQLQNVVFTSCCYASRNDVTLIKYLLECSPYLKKFVVHFHEVVERDEMLMFAWMVLKLQREYPAIDIDLY